MDCLAKRIAATADFYSMKKNAPLVLEEFGFYSLDRWKREGYIREGDEPDEIFGFSPLANHYLPGMAGCEAPFVPKFEQEVLRREEGGHELARDSAGRLVRYFTGRRDGFMPQYVSFPVTDGRSWESLLWRLDTASPERLAILEKGAAAGAEAKGKGMRTVFYSVGGYMYLRSLIGGEQLPLMLYDDPALIRRCMEKWLELALFTGSYYLSRGVGIDELLLDEDICYNHGALISPDMMREFLFPYYKALIEGLKPTTVHLATDGDCRPVIPLYREVGVNYMSPMEVASGCDVTEIGREWPELLIKGGIDKRILASGREAIARELERIVPVMKARGGWLPTCDHGVPEEVPFEDYLFFRQRLAEYND